MSMDRGRESGEQMHTVAQMLEAVDRYNAAHQESKATMNETNVLLTEEEIAVLQYALSCYLGNNRDAVARIRNKLTDACVRLSRASRSRRQKEGGR